MTTAPVVVIGAGLRELAAALEFAAYGIAVTVIDDDATPELPLGPEIDPEGVIFEWIETVAAPLRPGEPPLALPQSIPAGPLSVRDAHQQWLRVPDDTVFGIPSSPLSTQVTKAIGTGAALRAYLDRVMPVLKVGKVKYVSDLVTKRVGATVLRSLVTPQARWVTGMSPDRVPVATLAPGLNEALTRVGTLTGAALAYADRYAQLTDGIVPEEGWQALYEALRARLNHYGGRIVAAETVNVLRPPEGGRLREIIVDGETITPEVLIHVTREHSPKRTQVMLTHEIPPWWDSTGLREGEALQELGDGWCARTRVYSSGMAHTELLSDAGVTLSAEAVEERLIHDWITTLDLGDSTQVRHIRTGEALLEGEVTESWPGELAITMSVGDRGFARDLARILDAAPELRRELLHLTGE